MNFLKKVSLLFVMMLAVTFVVRPMDAQAATKITTSGVKSVSSSLVKGTSVSLRGTIKSNSRIKKVTGKITNSSGKKTYYSKTIKPNAYTCSLSGAIDYALKFGQLSTGTYKYVVSVSTASGKTKKVINQTFKVVKTASNMSVEPKISQSSVAKGKGVSVYGYVKSNYNIDKVTATIEGTTYVKNVTPNAKTYNLAGVDSAMKFSKLNEGSYNLKITATDASGTTKTKKVACTVTSSTSTSDTSTSDSTLTVTPKISPSQAYVGAGVYVYGSVTSNYRITSVKATIVGTDYTMTATPKTMSYSLSNMDSAMKFSKLTEGEYRLQVTAKDASGKEVTNYTTCTILQRPGNANGTLSAMVNTALAEVNANVGMTNKYNAYSGQAWCAYFVAWCARQAGVSTTAIPNSYLCRNLVTYYQNQKRYYTYAQVSAGSYVPKVGDLIFYSTSSGGAATHVGLVTTVDTSTGKITTKEGNTRKSTGGSWVYSYTMSYKSNKPWASYSQYIIGYAHPAY